MNLIKEKEWIELLNNMETTLLSDCSRFDFLNPSSSENKKRVRLYTRFIKNQVCTVALDYKELQWTGCMLPHTTIINPESIYIAENKNEKIQSNSS